MYVCMYVQEPTFVGMDLIGRLGSSPTSNMKTFRHEVPTS